uniref:SbtR family transcriptional regulator n=1 Tax=Micromonospora acroterricola TaxID=2202421 RepID=UPI002ED1F17F
MRTSSTRTAPATTNVTLRSLRHQRSRPRSASATRGCRAREHGALRADVTGADVILLMRAQLRHQLRAGRLALWQRYLAIIFDGLRPEVPTHCPTRHRSLLDAPPQGRTAATC